MTIEFESNHNLDSKPEDSSVSRRSFLAIGAAITAAALSVDSVLQAQAGETSAHNTTSQHEAFIRRSIALAEQTTKKGNFPYGAVLVRNGKVLMEAENTARSDKDPTRHAELSLISGAFGKYTREEISSSVLYASTEPCAMCAGAIYWGGIHTVVYGCSDSAAHKLAPKGVHDEGLGIPCRSILVPHGIKVIGPILEAEALSVHRDFWKNAHIPGM
jgi:tRNA(Arg) A34 adenosine deaminase TadA